MNFKSYLLEAMNITYVGKDLRDYLNKELPSWVLRHYLKDYQLMPFYQYKLNQDIPSPAPGPGIKLVKEWIEDWLADKLAWKARQSLTKAGFGNAAEDPFNHIRKVKFVNYQLEDPTDNDTGGTWYSTEHYISFNVSYLDRLCEAIYNSLEMHFIDTGFELPYHKLTVHDLKVTDIIDDLADIFVHEVTHAHQWARSKVAKIKKSYLVNQKKYLEIMKQATNTPGRHDIYISAPIEVEAYAQQYAHKLLRTVDYEDAMEEGIDYVIWNVECVLKYISSYDTHYQHFKSDNVRKQKILNRFLKKIYVEIDFRLDELKKLKIKMEKEAKAKADYDKMLDDWLKDEGIID